MSLMRNPIRTAIAAVLLGGGMSGATACAQQTSGNHPQLGLEGYCPVCIVEARKWMKGSPEHAVEYDGHVYIVEDAHRLYPALYEGRFDGQPLRIAGQVVKRQGKFVRVHPESLERAQ